MAALARDDHFLGAQIGALAVLQTWTRTLEWHPHVHMLVPAGGLAPDGRTWRPLPRRKRRFLAPVRALGKLFRGRFLALARRALPGVPLPPIPWEKRWVVFAKPWLMAPRRSSNTSAATCTAPPCPIARCSRWTTAP
ncbi:MAG: transposase [Polyangiaceae bacterium]|nr:transposase [Polyangiaceae bacterium]